MKHLFTIILLIPIQLFAQTLINSPIEGTSKQNNGSLVSVKVANRGVVTIYENQLSVWTHSKGVYFITYLKSN